MGLYVRKETERNHGGGEATPRKNHIRNTVNRLHKKCVRQLNFMGKENEQNVR